MRFCTVINCMDGRIQLPVIHYLQQRFDVQFIDSITEAGPNLILAENKHRPAVQSILGRLKISIENHNSTGIAVVGHYNCAGNPASKEDQIKHLKKAVQLLHQHYDSLEIIGLWVDENWAVHEVVGKSNNDK